MRLEMYKGKVAIAAKDYFHKYSEGAGKGTVLKENCVSYNTYTKQCQNNKITILRQAHGEGNYALIEFTSLPEKYKAQYRDLITDIKKEQESLRFDNYLEDDLSARDFFTSFRYADGSAIPTNRVDNITLWTNNASACNAITRALQQHCEMRTKAGRRPILSSFYEAAAKWLCSEHLQEKLYHNLPINGRSLRRKHEAYKKDGYEALVKNVKGNTNARKITDELLNLLLDIAALPTNPYHQTVLEIYLLFMEGMMDIVNVDTGELYSPSDFRNSKGEIIRITVGALKYYFNQKRYQAELDRKRLSSKDYNDLHRPHRHRIKPQYALSKVSFDDRDLVFKARDTKERVKAYYAYDVMSGCRIGSSYSRDKNEDLFMDCLHDTLAFCDRNGYGLPAEVEFEHHLVKQYEPMLEQIFPFVHFCAPGNSQEKRAEHLNRYIKYKIEKNNRRGIGRWYLKSRNNRIGVDKVDDKYKEKLKPFDQLVADDIADTIQYNNEEHPDHPGKTRLQVLRDNLNPNLRKLNKSYVYRYIGFETETSIQRNQYLQVQGMKYMLPSPDVLDVLGQNGKVTAYWLPDADGSINEVYMYQNGEYICTCSKLMKYNEAQVERTNADLEAKLQQDKYVTKFDKKIKEGSAKRAKLEVIDKRKRKIEESKTIELVPNAPEFDKSKFEAVNYAQKAMNDMLGIS